MRMLLCPNFVCLSHAEMTAIWEDRINSGMVDYADKDELVIYSVTVRARLPVLRRKHLDCPRLGVSKILESVLYGPET